MDVLAIRKATNHTKNDSPFVEDMRRFGKYFTSSPFEATAIDYDPDAKRFRVTFTREVMRRLVHANRLESTWTMIDGTRCQVDYQAERKTDHG